MQQILLATDLDGTLVGNDQTLKTLNKYLLKLREEGLLRLVYATGRSLHKYKILEQEKTLLKPDALVTAVGTEVYLGEEPATDWPEVHGWDRKELLAKLDSIHGLVKQPATEQRPYKISYFLKNPNMLTVVRQCLSDMRVDILYSHELYLDILPKGINKGTSLLFLASVGEFQLGDLIACGDSANDIDMLAVSKAIVVGNANDELLEWVEQNPRHSAYLASAQYAAGILEGLQYFQH